MAKRRNPVEHYTDGTAAWSDDVGILVRLRGQAGTLAGTALLGGAPWWWPDKLGTVSFSGTLALSTALVSTGVMLALALYYLRVRTIRSLAMKRELHMLSHFLRDEHIRLKSGSAVDIYQLSEHLCARIREYISILIHRKHNIGVAIRVAAPSPNGVVYKTVGRAGLNQHRHNGTTDLPANKGVARLLQNEKGRQGILIYHDLKAASAAGAYEEHPNDRSYPDDIKTFMVAPINGWDGEKKEMIGLLYITSPSSASFGRKHTDSVGFVADSIATIFTDIAIDSYRMKENRQNGLF